MKTAKEKAREYVDEIYPYVKGYNYSHMSKEEWNACYEGYLAGYNEAMRWRDPLLATAALSGCEIVKCQHYKDGKCNDPNEYVNKQGESVCSRREDAILYEDYLEMLNNNPPMMSFDRPAEF